MTPQQIIGQIRLVIGADPAIPDEELPKLIKSAMSRREADGIVGAVSLFSVGHA